MSNNSIQGNIAIGLSVALCAPMIGLAQKAAEQSGKRMNVLFIAVDDLKPLLGCYGDPYVKSPNIDALAKGGTLFNLTYCQQAVSGPTRASIMTGLRPDRTGVFDLATRMRDVNPNLLALPEHFKENGYETIGMGKIYDSRCVDKDADTPSWSVPFMDNRQMDRYFDQSIRRPANTHYQADEAQLSQTYKASTECLDVPDGAYRDGSVCNAAIAMLDKYSKQEKPFFLAVGFVKPHLPFVAPKRYWDMYDRSKLPVAQFRQKAKNSPDLAYHESGELQGYSDIPPLYSFSDIYNTVLPIEKERELIHGYYACVSYTDAQVGRVVEHLKAIGEYDNTIIVLWGDHGWHLGDHGLWNKHTNFEQATHVPMIIYVPGNKPMECNTPTEFVDIYPTLCDAAGISIPDHCDGVSLMPIVSGTSDRVKEFAMSQWRKEKGHRIMGYAMRDERYRFVVWYDNYYRMNKPYDAKNIIATELYDYKNDPLETVNIAAEPKNKKLVDTLYRKMETFSKNQVTKKLK